MPEAYTFDATEVEPAKPREGGTIPEGWYKAWITESELKDNAKKNGKFFEFTWQVIEGDEKGWHIWDRLNIENPSETAQRIAREALSAICHAVGVLKMTHSGQLHGKPCMVKVVIKPGDVKKDLQGKVMLDVNNQPLTHAARNEIKGYLPVGDPAVPTSAKPKVGAGAVGAVRGAAPRTMESPPIGDEDDSDLRF